MMFVLMAVQQKTKIMTYVRGYVVSKLENDGFALLRAEKFQRSKKEKINVEEAIGLEEM